MSFWWDRILQDHQEKSQILLLITLLGQIIHSKSDNFSLWEPKHKASQRWLRSHNSQTLRTTPSDWPPTVSNNMAGTKLSSDHHFKGARDCHKLTSNNQHTLAFKDKREVIAVRYPNRLKSCQILAYHTNCRARYHEGTSILATRWETRTLVDLTIIKILCRPEKSLKTKRSYHTWLKMTVSRST